MRVLLVEDNVCVSFLVAQRCMEEGHHVDIASDLDRALYLLHTGQYEVVLADLSFPQEGRNVLKTLREAGYQGRLYAMSGRDGLEKLAAPYNALLLQKPVAPAVLLAVLGDSP